MHEKENEIDEIKKIRNGNSESIEKTDILRKKETITNTIVFKERRY